MSWTFVPRTIQLPGGQTQDLIGRVQTTDNLKVLVRPASVQMHLCVEYVWQQLWSVLTSCRLTHSATAATQLYVAFSMLRAFIQLEITDGFRSSFLKCLAHPLIEGRLCSSLTQSWAQFSFSFPVKETYLSKLI